MRVVADLHVHSRFARACSKQLSIKNLEKYARLKGVNLLGTGDFQHPKWQEELKSELTEIPGTGIYQTKTGFPFLLQTEISLVYSQGGKGRRIHHLVLAPSFEVAEQISEALSKKGRLDYDGRPVFGMSSPALVEMLRSISEDIEVIPAHAWTPWFGVFGSKSGFDSLKECFQDQARHVHAIETGLSSDIEMNRRLSALDKIQLVSFSDLHSFWPWRIGREATVFDVPELTYKNVLKAIRTGEGLSETIEVAPEFGKYHYDGHRNCGVCLSPEESKARNKTCPECNRPLTMGVCYRVNELADREQPKGVNQNKKLIPLAELIAHSTGSSLASKKTFEQYYKLMKLFGNEFSVLLEVPEQKLRTACNEKLSRLIIKNREQQIKFLPGFDGEYGKPVFD